MILGLEDRPYRVFVKERRPTDGSGTMIENYDGMEAMTDVDLPGLAMEIYLLLKEDLRLERERGGWSER